MGNLRRKVDRSVKVCRTVLQPTRPTTVLMDLPFGGTPSMQRRRPANPGRQRRLVRGIRRGAIPKGSVRWEEVRVGSGVLKVQRAFWDKLEGGCRPPQTYSPTLLTVDRRSSVPLLKPTHSACPSSMWRGAPSTAVADGRCAPRCPAPSSARSARAAACPA